MRWVRAEAPIDPRSTDAAERRLDSFWTCRICIMRQTAHAIQSFLRVCRMPRHCKVAVWMAVDLVAGGWRRTIAAGLLFPDLPNGMLIAARRSFS